MGQSLTSQEAWLQIGQSLPALLQQVNPGTAIEVAETVLALAIKSSTTEIPKELLELQATLRDHFAQFDEYAQGVLARLFRYYRIDNRSR